jgi:uncharacterized protein YndB with AHSA1/START domain
MSNFAPVVKEITVPLGPERAFALFTEGIAEWWPLSSHSVFEQEAKTCVFERRVGGRIYEIGSDGRESPWGTVTVVEAPHRLVFTWHPGREAETAQIVQVRFGAVGGGTRVILEHTGWEHLGDAAARTRTGYDSGWDFVLRECYRAAAA